MIDEDITLYTIYTALFLPQLPAMAAFDFWSNDLAIGFYIFRTM
jgi:hypothetical protein